MQLLLREALRAARPMPRSDGLRGRPRRADHTFLCRSHRHSASSSDPRSRCRTSPGPSFTALRQRILHAAPRTPHHSHSRPAQLATPSATTVPHRTTSPSTTTTHPSSTTRSSRRRHRQPRAGALRRSSPPTTRQRRRVDRTRRATLAVDGSTFTQTDSITRGDSVGTRERDHHIDVVSQRPRRDSPSCSRHGTITVDGGGSPHVGRTVMGRRTRLLT